MLQAPQFWNSVCVFTHTELQLERPAAQVAAPPLPPEEDPPVPTLLPPVLPGGELLSLEQLAIKRKQPTTANKPACMRIVVCLSNLRALRKPDSRQSHSAPAHCVPSQRKTLLVAEPVSCRAAPRDRSAARHFASAIVTGQNESRPNIRRAGGSKAPLHGKFASYSVTTASVCAPTPRATSMSRTTSP